MVERSDTDTREEMADRPSDAERLSEAARDAAKRAEGAAREQADTAKSRMGSQAHDAADAMERIADDLAASGDDSLAGSASALAERLDRVASWLEDRSVDDLLRDTGRFARRNPFMFIAGSVAVGMALSRFFKASEHPSRASGFEEEWDEPLDDELDEAYEQELHADDFRDEPDPAERKPGTPLRTGEPASDPSQTTSTQRRRSEP